MMARCGPAVLVLLLLGDTDFAVADSAEARRSDSIVLQHRAGAPLFTEAVWSSFLAGQPALAALDAVLRQHDYARGFFSTKGWADGGTRRATVRTFYHHQQIRFEVVIEMDYRLDRVKQEEVERGLPIAVKIRVSSFCVEARGKPQASRDKKLELAVYGQTFHEVLATPGHDTQFTVDRDFLLTRAVLAGPGAGGWLAHEWIARLAKEQKIGQGSGVTFSIQKRTDRWRTFIHTQHYPYPAAPSPGPGNPKLKVDFVGKYEVLRKTRETAREYRNAGGQIWAEGYASQIGSLHVHRFCVEQQSDRTVLE